MTTQVPEEGLDLGVYKVAAPTPNIRGFSEAAT